MSGCFTSENDIVLVIRLYSPSAIVMMMIWVSGRRNLEVIMTFILSGILSGYMDIWRYGDSYGHGRGYGY